MAQTSQGVVPGANLPPPPAGLSRLTRAAGWGLIALGTVLLAIGGFWLIAAIPQLSQDYGPEGNGYVGFGVFLGVLFALFRLSVFAAGLAVLRGHRWGTIVGRLTCGFLGVVLGYIAIANQPMPADFPYWLATGAIAVVSWLLLVALIVAPARSYPEPTSAQELPDWMRAGQLGPPRRG